MRNQKYIVLLITILTFMIMATGCASSEPASIQTQEEQVQNATETVVEYGNTIRASLRLCSKFEDQVLWEDDEESTFAVHTSSWEFQVADYMYPEEEVMKNIEEVIGKKVGDTFTLWFEGGDGSYGYEYTILEIMNTTEDLSSIVVEYGDRIIVTNSSEEGNYEEIFSVETGEYTIWNDFSGVAEDGERAINEVIGKQEGDSFILQSEEEYKILKILKVGKK